MLALDPIRAVSHDILRVLQCFAIPPKLYKRSDTVVRLESDRRQGRAKKLNRRRITSKLDHS